MKTIWQTGAAALALAALPAPATAAQFFARGINGCPDTGIPNASSPVSYSTSCTTSRAAFAGAASARYGHVGASVSAASLIFDSVHVGWGTDAFFSDHLVFTSADPEARFADVAINMILDGTLEGNGPQWSSFVAASASLGRFRSEYDRFLTQTTGETRLLNFAVIGAVGTALMLRSPTFTVELDRPQLFSLYINTGAGGAALSQASAGFANSFELPTGQDAFQLSPGVTVNSGTWLVNNRFIDANAAGAVPEPRTWAMLILGFGLVGSALRRRRPSVRLQFS